MPNERKVPAAGQPVILERHGRDLQKVNERLRDLVASLKSEQVRQTEARSAVPAIAAAKPAAPSPDAADLDRRRLATELARAREAVEHATAERERLGGRLAEIEAENQRICDELVAAQEKTTELAQLYVALERLHGGLTQGEVVGAIQEIVINVVGSEELAVFERRGEALVLLQSFGVDPAPLRSVPLGRGPIGAAATGGGTWVANGVEAAPEDEHLTAVIPLRVGDRVVGAIAIWRLLGHKPGLGEGDHAVFDVLAAHAGIALHLRAQRDGATAA
jgi:hypothetical protein